MKFQIAIYSVASHYSTNHQERKAMAIIKLVLYDFAITTTITTSKPWMIIIIIASLKLSHNLEKNTNNIIELKTLQSPTTATTATILLHVQ
jgi:hypothetical protein